MTTDELTIDPELDRRLRRTLHAVAETVEDAPHVVAFAPPTRRRRRRGVLVAAGCGLAGVPLAAFMYGRLTSEYVQELPPPGVIQSGEIDGVRYWLVESFHEDVCGQQMPGVEIVSAARNQVGSEWNTGGIAYGEPDDSSPGCPAVDPTTWLADPTRAELAWMRLGEEAGDRSESGPWGAMIAVHPTVRSVIVQAEGLPEQRVPTTPLPDDPTGARYAVAALPEDTGDVTVSVSAAGKVIVIDETDLSRLGD